MYVAIKSLHLTCIVLSGFGFLVRAFWMLKGSPKLHARLTRIVPHVVDTLLLASAIALSVMAGQYPFVDDWVTAKVLGLIVYIVLGTIALKRGRSLKIRLAALVGALTTFAWIVSVALSKSPAGFLA